MKWFIQRALGWALRLLILTVIFAGIGWIGYGWEGVEQKLRVFWPGLLIGWVMAVFGAPLFAYIYMTIFDRGEK